MLYTYTTVHIIHYTQVPILFLKLLLSINIDSAMGTRIDIDRRSEQIYALYYSVSLPFSLHVLLASIPSSEYKRMKFNPALGACPMHEMHAKNVSLQCPAADTILPIFGDSDVTGLLNRH